VKLLVLLAFWRFDEEELIANDAKKKVKRILVNA